MGRYMFLYLQKGKLISLEKLLSYISKVPTLDISQYIQSESTKTSTCLQMLVLKVHVLRMLHPFLAPQ